jgi:hypothetical protein
MVGVLDWIMGLTGLMKDLDGDGEDGMAAGGVHLFIIRHTGIITDITTATVFTEEIQDITTGSYIPKIIFTGTETALKRGMVLEFPMAEILVAGHPSMGDLEGPRIMFFLTDRGMYFKEAAGVNGSQIPLERI